MISQSLRFLVSLSLSPSHSLVLSLMVKHLNEPISLAGSGTERSRVEFNGALCAIGL